MRSVGSELAGVMAVLSVPAALAFAFPFSAVGFKARETKPSAAPAAFVRLTPAAEAAALRAAKTSWQVEGGDVRRLRADMSFGELPETPRLSVMSVEERWRPSAPGLVEAGVAPYLPSRKAPPPRQIEPAGDAADDASVFPKSDLRKLE